MATIPPSALAPVDAAGDARYDPTDQQWEAIRTIDRHLLVAAGAGTGKTYTVIGKILYLLGIPVRGETIAHPLRLAEIAAITFTNQAAAELKERLRHELRKAGRADLAYEVDLARVGTIHSFCGEILRDFALRSGRAPAGRVLEEGEAEALAAEVVRDALVEALENGTAPGLETLLSVWKADDVQRWATTLLSRPDRLQAYWQAAAPGSNESALLQLARLSHERLRERLEQRGAVDFDRMIGWTRELLEDRSVRHALRRRIRVLIIDEFQDTDPLQKEIAYRLGDPWSRRPDTTRLVLVGDPKQSIYRFRRADVTVWNDVARDFEEQGLGSLLPLDVNRRSVPGILAFVDATVGQELARPINGEALQPFEVAPQPLTAVREGDDGPSVELLLTPEASAGRAYLAEPSRHIEAEGMAARMKELGEHEGYEWGDMALLLASWSDVELYEAALRRHDVPSYTLRSDGFYDRLEITDLLVALEAVRDPTDDRALLGFLRSPFVGVSDETLLRIAAQLPRPYWRGIGGLAGPEETLVVRGVELLRRFGSLRDRVPVARLVEELLEESGYLAHLALLGEDGAQAIANLRRFVDLARGAPEATLGDVLRRIADERARGDRVAQARLRGEKENVVLVTSIHSAKGLEWRAVFWGDLAREAKTDWERGLRVGRDQVLIGDPEVGYKDQSPEWQAIRQGELDERAAETKRLWYVAATRAKDLLVLSGLPLGKTSHIKGSPAEMLLATLPPNPTGGTLAYTAADGRAYSARIVRLDDAVAAAEAAANEAPAEGRVEEVAILPAPHALVRAPLGRGRHSASELMAFEHCPKQHWYRYVAGIREPARGGATPPWRTAAVRGSIVHAVLERLGDGETLDGLLEAGIAEHAEGAPGRNSRGGKRFRDSLRREIERVAAHVDYRALADRPGARRELPFVMILGEGAYVEGLFDLAAPNGSELSILDVKTGRTPPAEAMTRYALQRDVYVSAAAAIADRPVDRFLFAFSRSGSVEAAALPPGGARAARERVLAALQAVEQGDRTPGAGGPGCAFCGYRRRGMCHVTWPRQE